MEKRRKPRSLMGVLKPSTCQNVSEIDILDNEVDRISSLGDDLLSHILSYLTTNEAMKTSALSKRWKHVWTKTPVLDFSFNYHDMKEKDNVASFASFINRVLHMNEVSHLKKFSFILLLFFDLAHINAWIANLSERCIEELELYIGYFCPKDFEVPIELLMTFLIRVQPAILSMGAGDVKNFPFSTVKLRLKILRLWCINSECPSSMNALLASCPVLEKLEINQCQWDPMHIESSSLKYLHVNCYFDYMPAHVIKAPYLQQLYLPNLGKCYNGEYSPMGCLVNAFISSIAVFPLALVQAINGIQRLHLSIHWVDESLLRAIQNDKVWFDNLTHLELSLFGDAHRFLPVILKCSPNLASLILWKLRLRIHIARTTLESWPRPMASDYIYLDLCLTDQLLS